MNNITEIHEALDTIFKEIRTGNIDLKVAEVLHNSVGKRLKAYQMQLAYHALRGEAPNIPYLAAESVMPKTAPKPIEAEITQPRINGKAASGKAGKH